MIAYKDQAMCFETKARKPRAVLAMNKDETDLKRLPHTNTVFGGILYLLSQYEMVVNKSMVVPLPVPSGSKMP
jgi:hypothetical protein